MLVNIRFQDISNAFLFSVHIFFQVYAEDIRELPEVLADRVHLLPEVLRKSRSDSTDKKYSSAFVRFHKWALCNGLRSRDILPAKAFTVAIYLASLIQTVNSPNPVIAAFYAIKWFHDMYGLASPTNSKLVVNFFILFIYSQYHDNIYIQVYTCANGLDVGIAYICPLQLVRQFKYIYTHIVMQLQKLQVVQIHLYIYKVLVIGMNMNVNSNR